MWLTHGESMNATTQCQRVHELQTEYDWIFAGTDFFDGSHIVCNSSGVVEKSFSLKSDKKYFRI